jgi:hypothetical protein
MSVTAADRIKKLLSDETTWMGIYENQAFDSANFGHRVGMFFDIGDWDRVVLGSRAPESPQVAGWKYCWLARRGPPRTRSSSWALTARRRKNARRPIVADAPL